MEDLFWHKQHIFGIGLQLFTIVSAGIFLWNRTYYQLDYRKVL